MKILYVGSLSKRGTCFQRMQAMKDLEHEVHSVDAEPQNVRRLQNPFFYRFKRKVFGPSDLAGVNKRILQLVKGDNYNILWIDKGLTIRAETLRAVRGIKPNTIIVAYSPDDMLNPDNQSKQYLDSICLYDVHVTTKSYNINELMKLGAKDVYFVNNAFCPHTHRHFSVDDLDKKLLGGTVGFIGSFERERAYSIAFLSKHGIEIKIWGDWPQSWAKKLGLTTINVTGKRLSGDEYARAICSFDININFLRKVNRDLQTTRSIEIPACGGFMLAERTQEHLLLFKEGIEAEFFSTNEELLSKVQYYLVHDEERKRIARCGYERCINGGYNNQNRLNEVLAYIQSKFTMVQ